MAYLLGVDLGTSSVKAYIMDENGKEYGSAGQGYDIDIPQPGYAEQDCALLWESAVSAIAGALHGSGLQGDDIAAVGVTGQMHGLILLDADHQVMRPAIIWADRRSSRQAERLRKLQIEKKVGNPASTGLLLSSLLWIREHEPEVYDRTRKVLLPKDYIRYRMCGEIGTDVSDASGTLLFNCAQGGWDRELSGELDIPLSLFPDCHSSVEIAGTVTGACAEQTGLRRGTPVVYGGGDTPMQLVGNGVICDGELSTNIGTASQLNCVCGGLKTDDMLRLNTFHHIPNDKWLLIGASLNGGLVLKWLRKNLFYDMKDFEEMGRCAQSTSAGAEGLICLPFLNGERSPYMDEHAKCILWGMTPGHTRAHVIRAAMEGVVYSLKDCMEVLREIDVPLGDRVIASGGGAKSPLWLQIQADILEKEVYTTDGSEEACKGAAIAAGVGEGVFSSLEEGCQRTVRPSGRVYVPNTANKSVYEHGFGIYRELYRTNEPLFRI